MACGWGCEWEVGRNRRGQSEQQIVHGRIRVPSASRTISPDSNSGLGHSRTVVFDIIADIVMESTGLIISQRESDILLFNRTASIVFGISAVLTVFGIYISLSGLHWWTRSHLRWEVISYAAVAAALGSITLFVGMCLFWIKSDNSSKRTRIAWFVVLLLGLACGAVPYYLFVYVPALKQRSRGLGGAPDV